MQGGEELLNAQSTLDGQYSIPPRPSQSSSGARHRRVRMEQLHPGLRVVVQSAPKFAPPLVRSTSLRPPGSSPFGVATSSGNSGGLFGSNSSSMFGNGLAGGGAGGGWGGNSSRPKVPASLVLPATSSARTASSTWVEDMDATVGRIGSVLDVDEGSRMALLAIDDVELSHRSTWWYPVDSLRHVDAEVHSDDFIDLDTFEGALRALEESHGSCMAAYARSLMLRISNSTPARIAKEGAEEGAESQSSINALDLLTLRSSETPFSAVVRGASYCDSVSHKIDAALLETKGGASVCPTAFFDYVQDQFSRAAALIEEGSYTVTQQGVYSSPLGADASDDFDPSSSPLTSEEGQCVECEDAVALVVTIDKTQTQLSQEDSSDGWRLELHSNAASTQRIAAFDGKFWRPVYVVWHVALGNAVLLLTCLLLSLQLFVSTFV